MMQDSDAGSGITPFSHLLRVDELATRKATPFDLSPDTGARRDIARALGIVELRKLRLKGTLAPTGGTDWLLQADLGATVVQPCVVTLAPVTTRLDEKVSRCFLKELSEPAAEVDAELSFEIPAGDSAEVLGATIDLGVVMLEALALALPSYPRADGAELAEAVFTQPGTPPMHDADALPFANLAALGDKLDKDN
ncbi:MAG: DUF177 domain-containing protein [Halocynthiibacter sp.]